MTAQDKVAIVTGSGGMRATGRSIALWLARDGYDITLVDIRRSPEQMPADEIAANWLGIESVAQEIRSLGKRALPSYTDIRFGDQVDSMVMETIRTLGRIDLLVNNARAIVGAATEVVDLEESEWDRNMDVNAKGTFLCSRAVARYFLGNGVKGKIVNITSSGAKTGRRGISAYTASKFAINGLTKCLALELAPHGITVNDVCPGAIDSGRFSIREKIAAEKAGISLQEYERQRVQEMAKLIPTGKATTPDDVAAMVAFLASPHANQITGQSINVNGGMVMD